MDFNYVPLAVFLAIVVLGLMGFYYVRGRIRRTLRQFTGSGDLGKILNQVQEDAMETPRSLNACEKSVIPRIAQDFPDFDLHMAKTRVREYLQEHYGDRRDYTLYNVVVSDYLDSPLQKSVVFQAALSWVEAQKCQKRMELKYTYLLKSGSSTVGSNCPNCGATLAYGQRDCPYCGSRVINVQGNNWGITECRET